MAEKKVPEKATEETKVKKPAAKKPAAKKADTATTEKVAAKPAAAKKPAKSAKATADAKVRIKLVRSLTGCKKDQIATAHALGLKRPGMETVQPDNAATKGKINKIIHLVAVLDN